MNNEGHSFCLPFTNPLFDPVQAAIILNVYRYFHGFSMENMLECAAFAQCGRNQRLLRRFPTDFTQYLINSDQIVPSSSEKSSKFIEKYGFSKGGLFKALPRTVPALAVDRRLKLYRHYATSQSFLRLLHLPAFCCSGAQSRVKT